MIGNQRSVWVLSVPVCADFKETMYTYCCVSYETRDQHKDITSSYSRDACDTIDQIDYRNFNKISTKGAPQMAVDKEANSLSRVYS